MGSPDETATDVSDFECRECGELSAFSVSVRRERGGLVICPCCGSVELIVSVHLDGLDSTGEAAA
jgi:hypothetical protein